MTDQQSTPPPPAWQPPAPLPKRGWRGWSRRQKLVVGGVVVVGLIALGNSAEPRQPEPAASPTIAPTIAAGTTSPTPGAIYSLQIEGRVSDRASVSVTGTTNLPDQAVIELSASRAMHNAGEDDIRAVSAAHEPVTVGGGQFSGTLTLDESALLIFVGTGPGEDTIDTIDSDLTVCAQFQTGTSLGGEQIQPPSVIAIVGPYGEALATSPQVYVFGSATDNPSNWLEVMIDVPLKSPVLDELTTRQGSEPKEQPMEGFCL